MQAVLLAAGESSRFWPLSEIRHKSLISLMGKPLIAWTLEGLERSGISDVIVIQSAKAEIEKELRDFPSGLKINFVVQEKPQGMGDALLRASDQLDDSFVLLHAHQFVADLWLPSLIELKSASNSALALAGKTTDEPWKYGMFELKNDRATGIVEKPDAGSAPSDVRALGIYLLSRGFVDVLASTEEGHYAFERALNRFMKEHDVRVHIDDKPTISLKYPWDLFHSAKTLMELHLKPHEAASAQISPLAHIEGNVHIGKHARIYEYSVIKGPCYIGDSSIVGTHSIVRDHSVLESGVLIGAHAETARSIFQSGSSTHSGFFGDSIFDRNAKIGAGTITANVKVHRDEIRPVVKGERTHSKLNSLGVVVGEKTQLGIGVKTMPGVLIGANSFVGPGVVASENIGSNTRFSVKQETFVKAKRKREESE